MEINTSETFPCFYCNEKIKMIDTDDICKKCSAKVKRIMNNKPLPDDHNSKYRIIVTYLVRSEVLSDIDEYERSVEYPLVNLFTNEDIDKYIDDEVEFCDALRFYRLEPRTHQWGKTMYRIENAKIVPL